MCKVDRCERPVNSRGMCHMHYVWWLKDHRDEIRPKRSPTCTVEGCESPHHANGLCSPHAHRLERYGDPLVVIGQGNGKHPPRRDLAERFWEKVERGNPDECWLWTGVVHATYGRFWLDGNANIGAHRMAYKLMVGPIPEGLHLDHLCKVRLCCNPAHLEPVTQAENNRRAYASKTHCPHGHPYDEANTYIDTRGHRNCRTCRNAASRRSQQRQAARRRDDAGAKPRSS